MQKTIGLLFLVMVQLGFGQNTGTLKGKVLDENGNSISNVEIEGTTLGDETNSYGEYFLRKVPRGKYNLKVYYEGYETQKIKINV